MTRAGLAATQVEVAVPASDVRRTWPDVRALLESADLADPVRDLALDVFARLARAEAAAHGIAREQVHFHEVGALDSLADVVGVCAALHDLGVDRRRTARRSPSASGSVRTEHGLLPVPGARGARGARRGGRPGRRRRRRRRGLHADRRGAAGRDGDAAGAACRPMRVTRDRHRCRQPRHRRAAQRAARRRSASPRRPRGRRRRRPTTPVVLEANVDDLDPRLWPGVLAALLAAGASDAWLTPILMKKGRPAHTLSALAPPRHVDAVRRVVFTESSTIGVREHRGRPSRRWTARPAHGPGRRRRGRG